MGHRGHVDFVDDNLIGNKKALKRFLPKLRLWQEERGYPLKFTTEASINVSDDFELLRMLRDADFFGIFVGIESPDTDTLLSAQKKQNTKRSIAESVQKIYDAGIYVLAGFIVGFDTENNFVADAMIDCIKNTGIPVCMVGLLTALTNTQLSRRLRNEGRLYADYDVLTPEDGDQCTGGLNFVTKRPRRDILEDYRTILEKIYDPVIFFERVRSAALALNRADLPRQVERKQLKRDLLALGRLMWCVTVRLPQVRYHFWKTFLTCARRNPRSLKFVGTMTAFYMQLGPFSQYVIKALNRKLTLIDNGEWKEFVLLPAAKAANKAERDVPAAVIIG